MNNKLLSNFWVTNISKMNVSLADLNLTVKAFSSVNLLDKRYYKFTMEQILKSIECGSLHRKSNIILIRKVPPAEFIVDAPIMTTTTIPSRERSAIIVQNKHYEELELTDEEVASENADLEIE